MIYYIYNVKVFSNLFVASFYDYVNSKKYSFVINKLRNDTPELIEFLGQKTIHIGYYNDNYAYPIIHHIINHRAEYIDYYNDGLTNEKLWDIAAKQLFDKSQRIVESEFSTVKDDNKFIFQIDLCSIWGFNTLKRATSLKDIECAMCVPDITDLPFTEYSKINTLDEVSAIVTNNCKLTDSIFKFFSITVGNTDLPMFKGINMLRLRTDISSKYEINVMNSPQISMGEQLLLKLYSNAIDKPESEIKKGHTSPRSIIKLNDCLPKFMNFKTIKFRNLTDKFKTTIIKDGKLKGVLDFTHVYNGVKIKYGVGGAHACAKAGRYESDLDYGIYDFDVSSMYPSLAIALNIYPEHLDPIFTKLYSNDIVSVRLAEKAKPEEERNTSLIQAFKYAANGINRVKIEFVYI